MKALLLFLFIFLSQLPLASKEGGGHIGGGGGSNGWLITTQKSYINSLKDFPLIKDMHARDQKGKDIGVFVIDSGIHHSLREKVHDFMDFTQVCPRKEACDLNGHGSVIAQQILEVAPKAKLIVAKILDKNNDSNFEYLNGALDWAIENHLEENIKLINLSLVGRLNLSGQLNQADRLWKSIQELRSRGVLVTAAAGNFKGNNLYNTVSGFPEVLTIGSYDKDHKSISLFSEKASVLLPQTKVEKGLLNNHIERDFKTLVEKPDFYLPGEKIKTVPFRGTQMNDIFSLLKGEVTFENLEKLINLYNLGQAQTLSIEKLVAQGRHDIALDLLYRYSGFEVYENQTYISGTSYSCAIATGVLANLLSKNNGDSEVSLKDFRELSQADKIIDLEAEESLNGVDGLITYLGR